MSKTVKIHEHCGACDGTGLYVGRAERDGAAVVCSRCGGTGGVHRELRVFTGRVLRPNIRRVYQRGTGFVVGEGGGLTLESFGGIPYEVWDPAKPFPEGREDRERTCPFWFHSQRWKHAGCNDNSPGNRHSDCQHFAERGKCWKLYDDRNA